MLPYQQQIHSILESYLSREGASYKTIKNYRSDIDDFLHWFSTTITTQGFQPTTVAELTQKISNDILLSYRTHLIAEAKTESTITRRYSSIRALIRACEDAGITPRGQLNTFTQTAVSSTQPITSTANIPANASAATSNATQPTTHKHHQELSAFSEALKKQGVPQEAVSKKASHIADFLAWFSTRHTN